MLDFSKLAAQIHSLEKASFQERIEQQEARQSALKALQSASENQHAFLQRLSQSAGSVLWPLSMPLNSLHSKVAVSEHKSEVVVIGVDGSQIMPSHHEVHTCYLLNIGIAVIAYDSKKKSLLESRPTLFHHQDDIYPLVDRRRFQIDELYVSLERNILELQTLAHLAVEQKRDGMSVVALLDGSLIPWSVEKLSDNYKKDFLQRMNDALTLFQEHQIPLIAYLSNSRATDVINALRVSICPYDESNCRKHCGELNEEEFPCSKIWPLPDRHLWSDKLAVGETSAVFLSAANITKSFPAGQRTCFAYTNVGSEVARIEFPRWLYETSDLFEFALSVVLAQSRKGLGYPVCLAEAHNQAVIRGADRDRFFDLMTNQMVRLGFPSVGTSQKESKKRRGFV